MKQLIITLLLAISGTMAAAKSITQQKIDFVRSQFDISWAIPTGFKAEKWERPEQIYATTGTEGGKPTAGSMYWMGAVSADAHCRLLYQSVAVLPQLQCASEINVFRSFVQHELYAAIHGSSNLHTGEPLLADWSRYVSIQDGEQARTAFNADSVYVVDFPNVSASSAKGYTHCIGLYLCKAQYMSVMVKCLLTDEGYQRRDQYIRQMQQAVKYGNSQWTYDREAAIKAYDKIQRSFTKR